MRFSNIDLHCHSYVSDGTLSPEQVVKRAADNGVTTLSLTDHDTMAGLDEAFGAANEVGINLVNGIEISCQWAKYGVHILAYNFARDCQTMQEVQSYQTQLRVTRAQEISRRLCQVGLPETYERATQLNMQGVPGRPHFAQALMEFEAVSSLDEAFKKYLGAGKIGDVKNFWPSLEEIMQWVRQAGATAVIAHPRKYDFSLTKLRELIGEFKELGGAGMEVVVSGQKPGEIGMLGDMCQRFDLYGSVGSDFHSPKWAWAELGRIRPLPASVKPIWELWS